MLISAYNATYIFLVNNGARVFYLRKRYRLGNN